jgi:fused signal recognition particle receptor
VKFFERFGKGKKRASVPAGAAAREAAAQEQPAPHGEEAEDGRQALEAAPGGEPGGTAGGEAPAAGPVEAEQARKGFFARLKQGLSKTRQSITERIEKLVKSSRKIDEDFFEELEEILIQADVGVATTMELVENVRRAVKQLKLTETSQVRDLIRGEILAIMQDAGSELRQAPEPPTIYLVVGVNGVGKTTTIAKLAYRFKRAGQKVILAAADTYRAAAIDQLQVWADRVGVDLVKHQEGADPGAVVFDALNAARARNASVVIIDTAGRLHTKSNLMEEIAKVRRVIQRVHPDGPHEVLLVLDATTGQNAISQANLFKQAAGVTGIVLTKLDGTARGGIIIAVARELDIPVKLIGIGETLEDLRDFSAREFVDALFAE